MGKQTLGGSTLIVPIHWSVMLILTLIIEMDDHAKFKSFKYFIQNAAPTQLEFSYLLIS